MSLEVALKRKLMKNLMLITLIALIPFTFKAQADSNVTESNNVGASSQCLAFMQQC